MADIPVQPTRKKKNPARLLLILLGVLVLAVVAIMLFGGSREEGVAVETASVDVRDITQVVTASGKVRPEVEVKISSDVSGEIVFLGVVEGDRVEEGQLLVRVQPEFYAAQREQASAGLLQAQADVARAESELVQARAEMERQQGLFERGVIARADLEAAQTRYEVAQAQHQAAEYRVRSAEASLSQAANQLGKTAIYAPMSGVVSQLNVELGERVVGTAQMSGTEIMRIAELDQMQLEVDINENDVVHISTGDSARVEIDAYPGRSFSGLVTQIANSARVTGQGTQEEVTNFPVEVKITSPHNERLTPVRTASAQDADGPGQAGAAEERAEAAPSNTPVFRPGMSGTVDIYTETVRGATVVPIQAVTVRDVNAVRRQEAEAAGDSAAVAQYVSENIREVVFVVRDGKAELVEVETGIQDATHIEVLSGLTGGETVITGPFRLLRTELEPGQLVRADEGAGRPGPPRG